MVRIFSTKMWRSGAKIKWRGAANAMARIFSMKMWPGGAKIKWRGAAVLRCCGGANTMARKSLPNKRRSGAVAQGFQKWRELKHCI